MTDKNILNKITNLYNNLKENAGTLPVLRNIHDFGTKNIPLLLI